MCSAAVEEFTLGRRDCSTLKTTHGAQFPTNLGPSPLLPRALARLSALPPVLARLVKSVKYLIHKSFFWLGGTAWVAAVFALLGPRPLGGFGAPVPRPLSPCPFVGTDSISDYQR